MGNGKEENKFLMTIVASAGAATILTVVLCYTFFGTIGQSMIRDAVEKDVQQINERQASQKRENVKMSELQKRHKELIRQIEQDDF